MGINYRWQGYRAGLFGPLPEDLKRDILEIIAYQYPLLAPKLTLVSKDVQRWIEHIIYREVIFTCHRFDSSDPEGDPLSKFKRTIAVRPASFFAEHVKTLHFEGSSFTVDSILPVLNVCSGVTNFGCYATFTTRRDNQYGAVPDDDDDESGEGGAKVGPSKVYEYIQTLALERLFISQENLTELLKTPNPPPGPNGDPMGILRVTHLAITNGFKVPFSRFPRLTHWAFNPEGEGCVPKVKRLLGKPTNDEGAEAPTAEDQLQNQQIQSVVTMLSDLRARTQPAAKALREVIDPRLVQFTLPVSSKKFIEDDLWDLAREFPDEEMPVTYLDWEPTPKIYTFQEAMELGLFDDHPKPAAPAPAPAASAMQVDPAPAS